MRPISGWLAAAAGLLLLTPGEGQAQVTGFDREALIAEFVAFDNSRNEGRAYSDQKTSSALAWGESYYLNAYIKMYRVTGDARWLDKVIDHFDRMAANMVDHDGDGISGWQADRYSVSRMRARGAAQPGDGADPARRGAWSRTSSRPTRRSTRSTASSAPGTTASRCGGWAARGRWSTTGPTSRESRSPASPVSR